MRKNQHGSSIENEVLFSAGFVKGWITYHAHVTSTSEVLLTSGVANILGANQEGGKENPVRVVRVSPTGQSERFSEVETSSYARKSVPRPGGKKKRTSGITPAGRKKLSQMMKKRWRLRKRGQTILPKAA